MKGTQGKGATDLLRADHKKVKDLFVKYKSAKTPSEREELAGTISMELNLHSSIEEQIFYPAAEEALKDEKLIADSYKDHHEVKLLLDQLSRLCADQDEEKYGSVMKKLQTAVEDHIAEEESVMFPAVESSDLDLKVLGQKLIVFKEGDTANLIPMKKELRRGA